MSWFTGKKTYILGTLAVLTELARFLTGGETLDQMLTIVVPAVLAMTVRHGISTGA